MPIKNCLEEYGDLLVKFNVVFPEKISPNQRQAINNAFESTKLAPDPNAELHTFTTPTQQDKTSDRQKQRGDDEEEGRQGVQCAQQ